MAERLVAMTCTDHQREDAQRRSCPLVVSPLPQEECHSARNPELDSWMASTAAMMGASPTSTAMIRISDCRLRTISPKGSRTERVQASKPPTPKCMNFMHWVSYISILYNKKLICKSTERDNQSL
uniref:Uncharacterized protein n=1 Tax=Pipistrellus kuhlii TaxID=59472 RepID=A0A7J7YM33_PIPKU|nr:hypothetical protein mPipKuh1_010094 [Pipistrellus kuhlii]